MKINFHIVLFCGSPRFYQYVPIPNTSGQLLKMTVTGIHYLICLFYKVSPSQFVQNRLIASHFRLAFSRIKPRLTIVLQLPSTDQYSSRFADGCIGRSLNCIQFTYLRGANQLNPTRTVTLLTPFLDKAFL